MERTIELMKHNIKGYNKFMTDEKLNKMSIQELLNNTHPLDRKEFKKELGIKSDYDDNNDIL